MNSFKVNKAIRNYDVVYHTIDEATKRILPLDIMDIIIGYTRYDKNHFHLQLLEQVKEKETNKETTSIVFTDYVKYMLTKVNTIEGRFNKIYSIYRMFDYICDFRFLFKSTTLMENIKIKLNLFYFTENIINIHIYYKKLTGEEIDPENIMVSQQVQKRKLCSLCKLPGHNKLICEKVDLFNVYTRDVMIEGYNWYGYDVNGYNRQGYNKKGFDRDGYDMNHLHMDGYDSEGYDVNRYNREGYDRYGYNMSGYDRYGYDISGYDMYGYDRCGIHIDGINQDGYDTNGYDKYGYDRYGYDIDGYDYDGYDIYGYDIYQFNVDGYDFEGYDIHGYDMYGYNHEGYDINGYDVNGYDVNGYDVNGYDVNGYDVNGYDVNGYDVNGYDMDNE